MGPVVFDAYGTLFDVTAAARRDWPALIAAIRAHVKNILDLRDQILKSPKRYSGMDQDAARLVAPNFLASTPHARLPHDPRASDDAKLLPLATPLNPDNCRAECATRMPPSIRPRPVS